MDPKIEQLETLSQFSANLAKKLNGQNDETAVENLIQTLVRKLDIAPTEVVTLRKESISLQKVADFLEKFAEEKSKGNKKEIAQEEIKKIKAALLEGLGIRAEMVDLLLRTASPDEIKAVAANIRKEADKRGGMAEEMARASREEILRKINDLQSMRSNLDNSHMDQVSLNKFIALKREILRAEADRPIKEMCEEMEGKTHG